jgi:hypothetical protein
VQGLKSYGNNILDSDKTPKPTRTFRVDPGRFRGSLSETLRELFALLSWSEERNGDETKPNPASVAHATWWVLQIHKDAVREGSWFEPYVATDEDGDVVFEWRRNNRKLVIYISPSTVEYLKVERPAVTSDIADGVVKTPKEYRALWHWLAA